MQHHFDSNLMQSLYMASVPLAILMLETDEEKEFMANLYFDQRRIIVATANTFFPQDQTEVSEVTSDVIIAMCKQCKKIMEKECNELPGYIVNTTKNICRTRLRKNKLERESRDYFADEHIEKYADAAKTYAMVFDFAKTATIINEFDSLSSRDQLLISMKHIEGLSYQEMAERLKVKEGTIRTSLHRARKRLEKLIAEGNNDET